MMMISSAALGGGFSPWPSTPLDRETLPLLRVSGDVSAHAAVRNRLHHHVSSPPRTPAASLVPSPPASTPGRCLFPAWPAHCTPSPRSQCSTRRSAFRCCHHSRRCRWGKCRRRPGTARTTDRLARRARPAWGSGRRRRRRRCCCKVR